MIKRIEHLRSFGPYRDFAWDGSSLTDFDRYNLIYGWNYSGKTTLSRAFQALERGSTDPNLSGGQFKFSFGDGKIVDQSNLKSVSNVRVFNRDYVKRNIATEVTASAVFILGENAIRLRARAAHLGKRQLSLDAAAGGLRSMISTLETRRETIGREFARNVANQTGDKTFNRTKLEDLASGLTPPLPALLSDEELNSEIEWVRRAGDLTPQSISLDRPARLIAIARGLCKDFESSPVYSVLDEFSSAAAIERWAEEGLTLHAGRSSCAFCAGELTAARRADLEGHFSDAFRALSTRLRDAERLLQASNPEISLPEPGQIAAECRADLAGLRELTTKWDSMAVALRDDLLQKIAEKRSIPSAPFSYTGWEAAAIMVDEIDILSRRLIEQHNAVTADQQARATRARERIREYWAIQLLSELEQEEIPQKLQKSRQKLVRLVDISNRCANEVAEIAKDASGVRLGAERVTEILGSVLGDTLLTVGPEGPDGFRFYRAGQPAMNLSEGEQTAVTFSHFLASLESGGQNIEDLIVFVDDPISSLDSGNVYAVFGAIQRRLMSAKQLFVSTHNGEFFSYLKSFWGQGREEKKVSRFYFTRRLLTGGSTVESTLENLPRPLMRFASEYEFVFSELLGFVESPNPSIGDSYASANLLRRFLESYLGFRRPHPLAWGDKLEILISDPVRASAVKKFCDDGSHLQAKNRVFEHAVFVSNAQSLVREVIEALRRSDAPHFESLCDGLKIDRSQWGVLAPQN